MSTIIKEKFIKKYYFNIVQTDNRFSVVNTKRKLNRRDRDGIEFELAFFNTEKEAETFLEKYEKGSYDV